MLTFANSHESSTREESQKIDAALYWKLAFQRNTTTQEKNLDRIAELERELKKQEDTSASAGNGNTKKRKATESATKTTKSRKTAPAADVLALDEVESGLKNGKFVLLLKYSYNDSSNA